MLPVPPVLPQQIPPKKLIEQKLREQLKLLGEALIREVDGGGDEAESVLPYRGDDRGDRECVEMFDGRLAVDFVLDELLSGHVVVVVTREGVHVLHDGQQVQALLQGPQGQSVLQQPQPQLIQSQYSHFSISPSVRDGNCY